MLASMRVMSKSWAFKGLMILLVISFGIWGVGDMFRGDPSKREVARVGNKVITAQELEMQFRMDMPQIRKDYGPEMTAAQAKKIGLYDRTLQILIDQMAMDQQAAQEGVIIGNDVILQQLASMPQFRDANGKFDSQRWHHLLGEHGLSERMFVDFQKKDIARKLILGAVSRGVTPPKTMIDNLYVARGAKRLLEIAAINDASMKDIPSPSADDLQAYYEAHDQDFVAPEYRGITVAVLTPDSVATDTTVSDADVQKAYEARTNELKVPETRDLVQVILKDEAKAKALATAAQKSGDLSSAAKAEGLTPIVMNKIDDKTVLPELYTSVFGAEVGQISQPIKSSIGYHIVQLKKIYPAGVPSLENARKELIETLKQEKMGDAIARTVNNLDDAIAEGRPLEDIADSMKLRLARFAAVDAQGQDPNGKEVTGLPFKDRTLSAAFGQGSGEVGQVLDDGKGNYYVVRTDNVTPSQTRPLADVKAKVTAALTAERQAERAEAFAKEMVKAVQGGKSITSYASQPGIDIRLSKPISLLGSMDRDLPPTAIQHIFIMKKGDVVAVTGPGKHYVLRMADIVPVDPKKPEGTRLTVVDDLSEKMPLDFIDFYLSYAKTNYPVRINTKVLNDLKAQGGEAE